MDAHGRSTRSCRSPTSRRRPAKYRQTLTVLEDELGDAPVTGAGLAGVVAQRWHHSSPATWNRHVATVRSFARYCQRTRILAIDGDVELQRRAEKHDHTRSIALASLERLWERRDIALRERTLWRLCLGVGFIAAPFGGGVRGRRAISPCSWSNARASSKPLRAAGPWPVELAWRIWPASRAACDGPRGHHPRRRGSFPHALGRLLCCRCLSLGGVDERGAALSARGLCCLHRGRCGRCRVGTQRVLEATRQPVDKPRDLLERVGRGFLRPSGEIRHREGA